MTQSDETIVIPRLSYEQPVEKRKVHKRAISEVFPTDLVVVDTDELWIGVQWPVRHAFYSTGRGGTDSFLLLETLRQITILVCHVYYGTSETAHFVMPGLGFSSRPYSAHDDDGSDPDQVAVHVRGTAIRRSHAGDLQSIRLEADFYVGGRITASGHGDAVLASDKVYSRLRGGRTQLFLDDGMRAVDTLVRAEDVGRSSDSDVVLGRAATPGEHVLLPDLGNPFLFDHPLDHVAGMIPVEACRQMLRLVLRAPEAELESAEFSFPRALEFGEPISVRAQFDGASLSVQFVQFDEVAANAVISSFRNAPSRASERTSAPAEHETARDDRLPLSTAGRGPTSPAGGPSGPSSR